MSYSQMAQLELLNADTIEEWGAEHMRTPYTYAAHRS